MPQSVSNTALISKLYPVGLTNLEIVLEDEIEDNVLDVEGYRCTNRELVNLENAAVNIDNSNDVIIGPVTQFNVNGNVTIYGKEVVVNDGFTTDGGDDSKTPNGAKLGKSGKTESEDQDLKKLNKQTKYIKIFLLISFSLLILVGTILLIIFYTHDPGDKPLYPDPGSNQSLDNHQILDRSKWNGRPALRYETMETPVSLVIIKHTGGGQCFSFEVCAGKLQTIQSDAVGRGAADIYFSFLIGGDENIYVGRGWDVQPAQRNDMIDIAFMGSYTFDKPTSGMIDAAKLLLEDGVKNNKLTKDYKVVCHNQTSTTLSPGINLIKEVRTWEHYDPGTYFGKSLTSTTAT